MHFAGQVGVVERVRVAQALAGYELEILAAERVALACREVSEGHSEHTASRWLKMVHGAGEPIGRKPFGKRVSLDESAIDLLAAGGQNAVQADGAGHCFHPRD